MSYETMKSLPVSERILRLKNRMVNEERYASIEQAMIITDVYKANEDQSIKVKRALSLKAALEKIEITIRQDELIVGNRTKGIRAGVIFPESGLSWVNDEIENLYDRPQDKFRVHPEDIQTFREVILPYWGGKTLEDEVNAAIGEVKSKIGKVAKINQTDHAQGHICPNTEKWLTVGPAKLLEEARCGLEKARAEKIEFYESVILTLEGAITFIERYENLALEMATNEVDKIRREELINIANVCKQIRIRPAHSFQEAVQSIWFLFVILQMESNASSFSPGRMDQFLYPYYEAGLANGEITKASALEIIECLWLKFNEIVYLRSSNGAKYFAGFPIGFNVAIGGQTTEGTDATNDLSYMFLQAQDHLGLPQPNLSARMFSQSKDAYVKRCAEVIGQGSGMPQVFNDDAIIPALINKGIAEVDAKNYAIVGCVELTTHGDALGWSDAAMFNLVKALELALNNGECMLTGDQLGPKSGYLTDFETYAQIEESFRIQIDYFFDKMITCCEIVEQLHAKILPSAFLSAVIDNCIAKGLDVTEGGAHYNLSGIQAIQPANIADSLAALKTMVYEDGPYSKEEVLKAIRSNFENEELMRLRLLNHGPKYGNDIEWVDAIGHQWIQYFSDKFIGLKNMRGGVYHTGLYTVSAHVPMGANVGATPDGRSSKEPLADGGLSSVYGRDTNGPTALLKSVSRVDSMLGSNGTLLNMKFAPEIFTEDETLVKFIALLKTFIKLKIGHVQFNVVNNEDLEKAKENPELYKGLTIRVAGYTAYFIELADDLQNEIIARTRYENF